MQCSGAYDPVLGPCESFAVCPTCHLTQKECPGHLGHIELNVPVYNPLLFPTLFKLLKSKCASCHRFKVHRLKARKFEVQLKLLAMGMLGPALELDEKLASNDGVEEEADDVEQRQHRVLDEHEDLAKTGERSYCSSHVRLVQRKVISSFFSLNPK